MIAWLDTDHWQEILETMQSNRLRTGLTAAGVFWGAFMLVAMLGFGRGLETGVVQRMSGFATNSLYVWGERTTKPFDGFQPGRHVGFDNDDVEAIEAIRGVRFVCPRDRQGGRRGGVTVSRKGETGSFTVTGDVPNFIHVQPVDVKKGRFLNPFDMADRRKNVVIGSAVAEQLFDSEEDPLGGYVQIAGSFFQVVGVFEPKQTDDYGEMLRNSMFVPFSTYQAVFNRSERVGWLAVTADEGFSVAAIEERIKTMLRSRHHVSPEDPGGVGSWNAEEEFQKFGAMFAGISFLIWFVGVMTLIAGVIGVSNIMLISVKERTKEIGIRRAIGAGPRSIIGMIVQESVAITAISGYAGVVCAVIILEITNIAVGSGGEFFASPGVDLAVALIATLVLIFFGAFAGLIPARAALRINPVEALRME